MNIKGSKIKPDRFASMISSFVEGWFQAMQVLWHIHLWGLVMWMVVSIPLSILLIYILNRAMAIFINKYQTVLGDRNGN
jgi:hypothetical protein